MTHGDTFAWRVVEGADPYMVIPRRYRFFLGKAICLLVANAFSRYFRPLTPREKKAPIA